LTPPPVFGTFLHLRCRGSNPPPHSVFGNMPGFAGGRTRLDLGQTSRAHFSGKPKECRPEQWGRGGGLAARKQLAELCSVYSQGFDADHRDIELLKLRNFTVSKRIPDSVFTAEDSQDKIVDIIRPMVGYVSSVATFLYSRFNVCETPSAHGLTRRTRLAF
jgi:hypothetical protein